MNHVCTTITAISAYYIFFFYRAASLHLGVRPINERSTQVQLSPSRLLALFTAIPCAISTARAPRFDLLITCSIKSWSSVKSFIPSVLQTSTYRLSGLRETVLRCGSQDRKLPRSSGFWQATSWFWVYCGYRMW